MWKSCNFSSDVTSSLCFFTLQRSFPVHQEPPHLPTHCRMSLRILIICTFKHSSWQLRASQVSQQVIMGGTPSCI